MNKNLISLSNDVEANKKYIESNKSKLISDFVENNISNCMEFEPFVENVDFEYLGDISKMTYDEVKELYMRYYREEYTCARFLLQLKNTMHFNGLVFKDEYKDNIDIDENLAAIKLENISEFPKKIYRVFYRNGIYTLGDLLLTNYNDITKTDSYSSKIKGLGNKSIKSVIEYVHSLGFLFKDEDKSTDYIISRYKDQGIIVVGDVVRDTFLCNVLYENNIYTLDDLKNMGSSVLELPGIGPGKKRLLRETLSNLDDFVDDDFEFCQICNSIEMLLIKLNKLIGSDGKKLAVKEQILSEYTTLLDEMEHNKKYEEELDMKISAKMDEYVKVYRK